MPHICLDESKFYFPAVEEADEEGLLLIGGKVTSSRIIEAYPKGIFPWYESDSLPLWFSPNPRFILFPDELHISRSMKKLLTRKKFEFKIDSAFAKVINECAEAERKEQNGTWLTVEMKKVYTELHHSGYGHSAEAWQDGVLVGGMYGLQIGKVFFGESMFSKMNNASKFAFINYVQNLQQQGVELMDCQVYTEHVESLGARLIDREDYLKLIKNLTSNFSSTSCKGK
jgi:leucyl/phenylalanyl-tRNA--protein transferase